MPDEAPRKIPERFSKFFRESILGILILGTAASIIATYLVEYQHQIWDAIKNILPWIALLLLVSGVWWWNTRTMKTRFVAEKAKLKTELSNAQMEIEKKDLALDNMSDALSFDDILLVSLSRLVSTPPNDRMNKLRETLQRLLDNAVLAKVGNESNIRASIFLPTEKVLNRLLSEAFGTNENTQGNQSSSVPSPTTNERFKKDYYITIWAHIGLDSDTFRDAACYIGDDPDIQRGLAGLAFRESRLIIDHMVKQDDGRWICKEHPDVYKRFVNHNVLRYKTLAVMPIVTLGRKGSLKRKTVGVVCFDSMNPTLFDGEEAKNALDTVSSRIGAILSINWQLSRYNQADQKTQA